MDYKITNFDVSTEQIYLDQVADLPIDVDFSLSDYEGDIKKVLNCEIIPYIRTLGTEYSGKELQNQRNRYHGTDILSSRCEKAHPDRHQSQQHNLLPFHHLYLYRCRCFLSRKAFRGFI